VEILESLQDRLPETGKLQRIVIFGSETGARHLSAVLVRIPAAHEFPLHTHPLSEDCFFALSGAGDAIEPGTSISISAPACVWIPMGHPHGLRAGPTGLLELGVQAPPDPTAVPFDPHAAASPPPGLLAEALCQNRGFTAGSAEWIPVFPNRPGQRYLDPCYATLPASGRLVAKAGEDELLVIVATGVVQLASDRRLRALGAFLLDPRTTVELHALEGPALLFGIRARVSGRGHR
jgi:quercetin dioxygenase-like cupin family protein